MSTRLGKRYDTSYKKRENPKRDPYTMIKAPKGPAICRKCLAIHADKRWHFDEVQATKLAASPGHRSSFAPPARKSRTTTRKAP